MFKPRLWIIVATVVGTLWGGSAAPTTAVASVDPTTCDLPRGAAEGPPARGAAVHAVGTVKAVMLFVDFPDATTTDGFTPYVDQLKPSEAWFSTSSYGRLKLQVTTVKQWFRMPSDASDYDFTRGLTFDEHKRYFSDAIAAADSTVDFSQYKIVYVVAADNATAITYSPAFIGGAAGVEVDGTTIGFGATFGQDMWYFGSRILNHETGHVFGLPDLYDYDPVDFTTDHRFVGFWDLMGWILGDAPDFMAWHKWHLGWIDSTQVVCQRARGHRTAVLSPVEQRGGKKLALIRSHPTSCTRSRSALGRATTSTYASRACSCTACAATSPPVRAPCRSGPNTPTTLRGWMPAGRSTTRRCRSGRPTRTRWSGSR